MKGLVVWTPDGPRGVSRRERWTKRCACGQSYIPDEWAECDACLFKLAGLDTAPEVPPCPECDPHGIAEGTLRKADVANALRTLRHRLAPA